MTRKKKFLMNLLVSAIGGAVVTTTMLILTPDIKTWIAVSFGVATPFLLSALFVFTNKDW